MRLAVIEFRSGKVTHEQVDNIHKAIVHGDVSELKIDSDGSLHCYWRDWLVDLDKLDFDIPYVCKKVIMNTASLVDVATEKRVPPINQKVQVVVPGLGLLAINEVCNVNDCCTDYLRTEYLNEGWKILAICIQPDQRRPDYILGRTKES